jgi:hypothetical protein
VPWTAWAAALGTEAGGAGAAGADGDAGAAGAAGAAGGVLPDDDGVLEGSADVSLLEEEVVDEDAGVGFGSEPASEDEDGRLGVGRPLVAGVVALPIAPPRRARARCLAVPERREEDVDRFAPDALRATGTAGSAVTATARLASETTRVVAVSCASSVAAAPGPLPGSWSPGQP